MAVSNFLRALSRCFCVSVRAAAAILRSSLIELNILIFKMTCSYLHGPMPRTMAIRPFSRPDPRCALSRDFDHRRRHFRLPSLPCPVQPLFAVMFDTTSSTGQRLTLHRPSQLPRLTPRSTPPPFGRRVTTSAPAFCSPCPVAASTTVAAALPLVVGPLASAVALAAAAPVDAVAQSCIPSRVHSHIRPKQLLVLLASALPIQCDRVGSRAFLINLN